MFECLFLNSTYVSHWWNWVSCVLKLIDKRLGLYWTRSLEPKYCLALKNNRLKSECYKIQISHLKRLWRFVVLQQIAQALLQSMDLLSETIRKYILYNWWIGYAKDYKNLEDWKLQRKAQNKDVFTARLQKVTDLDAQLQTVISIIKKDFPTPEAAKLLGDVKNLLHCQNSIHYV